MSETRHWSIESEAVLDRLKRDFAVRVGGERTRPLQFYDSFPWQLWFSDRILCRIEDRLYFCSPGGLSFNDALAVAEIEGKTPRFWWRLPENLAVLLQPHLKLRALRPTVRCARTEKPFDIKNEDGKTVVRIFTATYRRNTARGAVFLKTCSAEPVRGYEDAFAEVCRLLDALEPASCNANPLRAYFDAFGGAPEPYAAKPRLQLSCEQPARDVLAAALKAALEVMRLNEKGVVEDLDTEFLHDYRVALRSARAVLTQLKGVFPPDDERRIKDKLRELGRRTNAVRDLDVYLLDEDRYRAMVPPDYAEALNPMFDDFRARRRSEFARLSRYLASKTYADDIARLGKRVDAAAAPGNDGAAPHADTPIGELVRHRLSRRLRKLRKRGRAVHQRTPDEAIHALRLQCKKLRYMFEFFASLFDDEAVADMIGSMRRLQNLLGDFNDLSVQQQALYEYYTAKRGADPALGLAIGIVIGEMARQQAALRKRLVKHFDRFDSPATVARFETLLASGVPSTP